MESQSILQSAVEDQYNNRMILGKDSYYDLRPDNFSTWIDCDYNIAKFLDKSIRSSIKILVIGSGYGFEVYTLIKYGIKPNQIYCVDILKDRVDYLTNNINGLGGIKCEPFTSDTFKDVDFDYIYIGTVFSSILNNTLRDNLMSEVKKKSKIGSYIIIVDMIYRNSNNKDVKPVSLSWLKKSFKGYKIESNRIILFPKLARKIWKISKFFYFLFNIIPFLKTHRFTIIFINK